MYNKRLIVDFDDTIAFTKNRDWEKQIGRAVTE